MLFRSGEGEPIFTDFQRTIYVDRLPPQSAVASFSPLVVGVNENRRALVRSTDLTADNVHVFLDLPAAKTNADVLAMVGGGSQSSQLDRDLFAKDFSNLTSGNHVLTVVTYEISGNVNVQRFAGQTTSTIFGRGLGDLDFDGLFKPADITLFRDVLLSRNAQFNPAADVNGDGLVDLNDLAAMQSVLQTGGADAATMAAYQALVDEFTLHVTIVPAAVAENGGAGVASVDRKRRVGKECIPPCRSRWSPYH